MIEPLKYPEHWRASIEKLQNAGKSDAEIREHMEHWKAMDAQHVGNILAIEPEQDRTFKAIAQINKEIEAGSFDFVNELGREPKLSDFPDQQSFQRALSARRDYLSKHEPPAQPSPHRTTPRPPQK